MKVFKRWFKHLRAWWDRRATLTPMPPAMMNMDGYYNRKEKP